MGLNRKDTAGLEHPYPADKYYLSIGMGIKRLDPIPPGSKARGTHTPDEVRQFLGQLTEEADAAVYQSKSNGRNRASVVLPGGQIVPVLVTD